MDKYYIIGLTVIWPFIAGILNIPFAIVMLPMAGIAAFSIFPDIYKLNFDSVFRTLAGLAIAFVIQMILYSIFADHQPGGVFNELIEPANTF
jgi:hypothetical protein